MTSTPCPICDETIGKQTSLRTHTWNKHNACHHCGETCEDRQALYIHWHNTHPEDLSRIDRKQAKSVVNSAEPSDQSSNQNDAATIGGVRRRTLFAGVMGVIGTAGIIELIRSQGLLRRITKPYSDSIAVESAPISSSTNEDPYAVMGTNDANTTVTYFGNWKCPYCARFSTGYLRTLISDYVIPGEINIKFRNLTYANGEPFLGADSPEAARAGLAVWKNDPESYWQYHESVFSNQPPESNLWASVERLVEFARSAGVSDPSVVREAIQEERYRKELQATTTAVNEAGISGTPTLLVQKTTISPFDQKQTEQAIENAISDS